MRLPAPRSPAPRRLSLVGVCVMLAGGVWVAGAVAFKPAAPRRALSGCPPDEPLWWCRVKQAARQPGRAVGSMFPLKPYREPEVKSHLKALYRGQRDYMMEKDTYTTDLSKVGFMPELGNRYAYFSAESGRVLLSHERRRPGPALPARAYHIIEQDTEVGGYPHRWLTFSQTGCTLTPVVLPDGTRAGLGVTPWPGDANKKNVFIGAAAADLDGDSTVDCWSIATEGRTATDGSPIPAGVPYNEVNDVQD